jgi:hypothetical protein
MIDPAELEILVYWMKERDRIRAAKEAGKPKPWTEDPLLRDYRWCNVRRMDDRVSRELFERWYDLAADRTTTLTAAMLARLINWPESLLEATDGKPFRLDHLDSMKRILEARGARGEKVFTGAYLIPPGPREPSGLEPLSKVDHVVGLAHVIGIHSFQVIAPTMEVTWREITSYDGMGSFLAGQVVADLVHLELGKEWPDRDFWAPLGPGSARGINRLHGRPKDKAVTQVQFHEELYALIKVLCPRVEDLWSDRRLQAMDIQNCLCEFDKYRRLTLGEGTVRARYDGAAGSGQGSMFT